jgi:hypothetical protein
MPLYSLYLTNQDTTITNNQINQVYYNVGSAPLNLPLNVPPIIYTTANTRVMTTWNIDFDELFKGSNYKYSKCRLRVKTKTVNMASIAYPRNTSSLTCSLASMFNAQTTYFPTFIASFTGADSPVTSSILDIPINTMESTGVNINVPYGSQPFSVAFNTPLQPNELLSRTNDFLLNFLFIFELY